MIYMVLACHIDTCNIHKQWWQYLFFVCTFVVVYFSLFHLFVFKYLIKNEIAQNI